MVYACVILHVRLHLCMPVCLGLSACVCPSIRPSGLSVCLHAT